MGEVRYVILLGVPGAGKGTQAKLLAQGTGYAHLSTGDLLRESVANKTEMGLAAQPIMKSGGLVPDEMVLKILKEWLNQSVTDAGAKVVLDGFPRTFAQAEALAEILKNRAEALFRVILIEIDEEVILERLAQRRRVDDTPETIRTRLKKYWDETSPLIDYYTNAGLLVRVSGNGGMDEISKRIFEALDESV